MAPSLRAHLDCQVVRHIESRLPRTISEQLFDEVARPVVETTRYLVRYIQSRVPNEVSDQIFAELTKLGSVVGEIGDQHCEGIFHPHWKIPACADGNDILQDFLEPSVVGTRLAQWCKDAFFKSNTCALWFPEACADEFLENVQHGFTSMPVITCNTTFPLHHADFEKIIQRTAFVARFRVSLENIVTDFGKLRTLHIGLNAALYKDDTIKEHGPKYVELREWAPAIRRAQEKGITVTVSLHYSSKKVLKNKWGVLDKKEDITAWFEPFTAAEEAKERERLKEEKGFAPEVLWYKGWFRQHSPVYKRIQAEKMDAN